MGEMNELLGAAIKRNPLRSQREACLVSARRSIAALGPAKAQIDIDSACDALCAGLFDEAYIFGSEAEQARMFAMMREEYIRALGPDATSDKAGYGDEVKENVK